MEAKYIIDTEENKAFLQENVRALLTFGRRFPSPGGSSYYLGDDGTPWTDRPRETWITSRMTHVYSIGTILGKDGCGELVDKALGGLHGELKDTKNGGWNADGAPGIVYTTDWNGTPVVHDRMHWTLAEAINTSAVLYRVTNDQKYAEHYSMFMKYLDETVLDHTCGSWFHQLDEHNCLKDTVWPGKSDVYHALQSMLIPYSDVSVSIAKALV